MDTRTSRRLLEINQQFYQTFSREFSSSRKRIQPGVRRILDSLNGDERILDLGSGPGTFARELAQRGHRGGYLGVDSSAALLEAARGSLGPPRFIFIQADLASADWDAALPRGCAAGFDLVTAFAVLHHIPTRLLRLNILGKIHGLLRPGGQFVHSEWQFMNSPRLARRVLDWQQAGLSAAMVDPGDTLLDWRSGGVGLRYVHLFSEAELNELASASGFSVLETFLSDGANNRLSLYQTWRRDEIQSPAPVEAK